MAEQIGRVSSRLDFKSFISGVKQSLLIALVFFVFSSLTAMVTALILENRFLELSNQGQSLITAMTYLVFTGALGISANFESSLVEGSAALQGDIWANLSLLGALFIFTLFRRAKNLSAAGNISPFSLAFGSSLGLASFLTAITFVLANAPLSSIEQTRYSGLDLADYMISGFIVFTATWLGASSVNARDAASVAIAWGFTTLRVLVILSISLILAGFIVSALTDSLRPDFRQGPAAPGALDPGLLLGLIGIAFLFLPTLILFLLSALIGASVGIHGDFGFDPLNISGALVSGLQQASGFDGTFGAFSVGVIVGGVSLFLGFVISLYSGAIAAHKYSLGEKNPWIAILGSLFIFFSVFIAVQLTSFGAIFESVTTDVADSATGSVGDFRFGIILSSLTLPLVAVISGAILGATVMRGTILSAASKLSGMLSGKRVRATGREIEGFLVSTLVAVILAVVTIMPLTFATYERAWAALDGPREFGESWAKSYSNSDLERVKSAAGNWRTLNEAAQIESMNFEKIEWMQLTETDYGEKWSPGDLTATIYLSGKTELGEMFIRIDSDSQLRQIGPFGLANINLSHPDFDYQLAGGKLSVTTIEQLDLSKIGGWSINGQKIDDQELQVTPGKYRVSVPEYGIFAGYEGDLLISSDQTIDVPIGNRLLISTKERSEMYSLVTESETVCLDLSNLDSDSCFSEDLLKKAVKPVEGVSSAELALESLSQTALNALDIEKSTSEVEYGVICDNPRIESAIISKDLPENLIGDENIAFARSECVFTYGYTNTYVDNFADQKYELPFSAEVKRDFVSILERENGTNSISLLGE